MVFTFMGYGSGGNIANDGDRTYAYDAFHRLTTVARKSDGAIVGQYTYDALGRRGKIVSNGGLSGSITNVTIRYLYDGNQCVEEVNVSSGVTMRQFVWGQYIDELIQMKTYADTGSQPLPAGVYYPLSDLLYRSQALTDDSGNIQEAYDCDAYGNTLIYSGSGTDTEWFIDDDVQSDQPACEYIFQGRQYDPESQIYNYRGRHYHPPFGRFISRDPVLYRGGINLYAAFSLSPSNRLDPLGLLSQAVGPTALIISFISHLDAAGVDESDIIKDYQQLTGKTITVGRAEGIDAALGLLEDAINPDPPMSFANGRDLAAFKATQEFRGILRVIGRLTCDSGKIVTPDLIESHDNGYTPIRSGSQTFHYSPREGNVTTTSTMNPQGCCYTWKILHQFRVGQLGQLINNVLTGVGVPWAWEEIDYTLCCDGTNDIEFLASNFPSQFIYLNGSQVGGRNQSDLPAFIFTGGGVLAPGGPI